MIYLTYRFVLLFPLHDYERLDTGAYCQYVMIPEDGVPLLFFACKRRMRGSG